MCTIYHLLEVDSYENEKERTLGVFLTEMDATKAIDEYFDKLSKGSSLLCLVWYTLNQLYPNGTETNDPIPNYRYYDYKLKRVIKPSMLASKFQ